MAASEDEQMVLAARQLQAGHGDMEPLRMMLAELLLAAAKPYPFTMARICQTIAATVLTSKPVHHRLTVHGHPCCELAPPTTPPAVARCGGPALCSRCGRESAAIHAEVQAIQGGLL